MNKPSPAQFYALHLLKEKGFSTPRSVLISRVHDLEDEMRRMCDAMEKITKCHSPGYMIDIAVEALKQSDFYRKEV